MSELTPTNEEHLAELVRSLNRDEVVKLFLQCKHGLPMIDVYVVPMGVEFDRLSEDERLRYWKASFMAVDMHRDVWTASPRVAIKYR